MNVAMAAQSREQRAGDPRKIARPPAGASRPVIALQP